MDQDNLSVGTNSTRRRHTCDCGFQWLNGQDGSHHCSEYYRQTIKLLEVRVKELEEEGVKLWTMLDNIDTACDALKPSITNYTKYVNKEAAKRFEVTTSDGYNLFGWAGNKLTNHCSPLSEGGE